jgi:hypothetical protein
MKAVENKILLILYEKLKNGSIQAMGLEELGKEVRTKRDKLLAELLYLKTKGLIDFRELYDDNHMLVDARSITIINKGIMTVEAKNSQSKDLKSSFPSSEHKDFTISLKQIIIALACALFSIGIGKLISPLSNSWALIIAIGSLIVLLIILLPSQMKNLLKVYKKISIVFRLLKVSKKIVFVFFFIIPLAFFLFKRDWSSPKIIITALSPAVNTYGNYTTNESVLTIVGNVEDNKKVASLFINNVGMDIVKNEKFTFFAKVITLHAGENKIDIVAYDSSGNKGEKEITVTYAVTNEATKAAGVIVAKVQINSDIMIVNSHPVQIDAPAEIKNGRTFLPLRAISEALGATVDWIAETQGITVTLGENTIGLQVGNTSAVVNGTVMILDAAPYIKNYRTMVPFRVIAEGLGATVEWDPALRIMTVTYIQ